MRIVIVGGIAAGMSAAAKLRRINKEAEIIVYEKSPHVSFGACGMPYYVGGFFDHTSNMIVRTPEQQREAGIHVQEQHEVLKVDAVDKTVEVKNLLTGEVFTQTYDKLMIATGAAAIIPPIANVDLENVYTVKSLEDAVALRGKMALENIQKVAIIGAGFIGLEMVEAVKHCGKEVAVFQLEDRVLKEVFDEEITGYIEEELVKKDVALHLQTKVVALEGEHTVNAVCTANQTFPADLVIIAAGVKPCTDFLADTGIDRLPNGAIVVDQQGRTSLPDVYAAGDCATVPHLLNPNPTYIPLATIANKLGRIVGENLGGVESVFPGTLGSSCIKVLDLEAGRTGLTEKEAKALELPYKTVFVTDKNQTDYYPGQVPIHVKLIYHEETKVLLGGQIVGEKDAVMRTNALAVAITQGMTTSQLAMADFCYAPPFARTWDVLNIAGSVAK